MVKNVLRSAVVNVPVETAYAIWQDFANYPQFLPHVIEIRVEGRRLFWQILREGRHRQWIAEIVELTPHQRIAWHGRDGRHHRSVVTFRRLAARRTEVCLGAEYELPPGERDSKRERFDRYLAGFKLFAERATALSAWPHVQSECLSAAESIV